MRVIVLILFAIQLLISETINGVAITVNGVPITLYQIDELVKQSKQSRNRVVELLIKNALEESETEKLRLKATDSDINRFVDNLVRQNRLNSREEFYQALKYQGISKEQFLERVQKEVLKPKLYQRITSSKISQPTDKELKDFYNRNRADFLTASHYDVIFYQSRSREALIEKITNPLLYISTVVVDSRRVEGANTPPQLKEVIKNLKVGEFSKIIAQNGAFLSIYLSGKGDEVKIPFEEAKGEIAQKLFIKQQTKILKNFFEGLKREAKIEYLR